MGKLTAFIFLHSKITADGDCSHEIKRCLLLGRKTMTNLDSILKSRDITLPKKVCLVKAMVFPSSHVWMWELDYKESWAPKNWCFRTVVLKTVERVPWTAKRSDQSILKEISPEDSLEGLILKLDLLAVQGTLKSLLQHHSSKASILRCSAFFTVQLSHPYMTTGKNHSLD